MSESEELAKDIGLVSAMTIGIGTMIGAGIFVLPGIAAQQAGPVVVVSFIIGGFIAVLNAFSVSELGTAMPKAGGAYYYINRSLGPVFGSISGLGDWIGLAFASAFYTIGFGQYLRELLTLPTVFFLNEIQVGAIIAGVVFVGVNYIGAKETGGIQTVIVAFLLAILTLFALVGWFAFDWATVTGEGGITPFGGAEILPATGLVFVSYLGYAKIATVGEEMKDPGRNLPIAIVGSVVIVTIIYTILVTLMLGIVSWPSLDADAPVAHAAEVAFPAAIAGAAATLMTLGALLATASSANASILASARINFAMGRDRIVSDWLNQVHPRFATPYRSILVTGAMIVVLIVALGRDVGLLAEAASVLHLIVYALLNAAVIVFRETEHPNYNPEFEVPHYPTVPVLGLVCSLGLIAFMPFWPQVIAVGFVIGAVAWYFLFAKQWTPIQGRLGEYIRERPDEMPEIAVSAAEAASPAATAPYNVMVPVSNPATEDSLVTLGATLAAQRDGAVHVVHIVDVPAQTSLEHVAERLEEIDPDARRRLSRARAIAEEFDADVETHTVVSHRPAEELFATAERLGVDTVVMGWSPRRPWAVGRTGGPIEELTRNLPCDVLVFKDRGFDTDRILVPTAGGPDSILSAEVAQALHDVHGADVSLLHVVGEDLERARATAFLGQWADEQGLGDATILVDTSGDIEGAIKREAADHGMILLGATGRGLLYRLLRDSPIPDVVDEVEKSILLAERPEKRSLRERLIGRPTAKEYDQVAEEPPEEG